MTSTSTTESFISQAGCYFSRTSVSNPAFIGPDHLAFLENASGTNQVAILTLSTGEMSSVTGYKEGLLSLLGSPVSGRIVFGMDVDGNERQQLYTIARPDCKPIRMTDQDKAFNEPGALSTSGDAVIFRSNARDESTFDIVVSQLDSGASETWLENGGQVSAIALDGDRALVILNNGNMDSDLLLVGRDGTSRNLTEHSGEQWIYSAAFSRGGDGVWFLSNLGQEFVALLYHDLGSAERRVIFDAAWDIEIFSLSPDGQYIAISVNEAGVSRPAIISAEDGRVVAEPDIDSGVIDRFSWSPDSSSVAFGFSTIEKPSVIMLASIDGTIQVVAQGDDVDAPPTVTPEAVLYTSWDGRGIPGFFLRPNDVGPFPVLVEIHGGPESQRRLDYGNNGASLQYLASLGIGVLALNIRGSTGYGKEYCHLDDREKRLDAVRDIEYAVRWLREQPDVIADKIAVYGISYGGFMTLSALARLPKLWAAGVEMVGMAHLGTFLERTGAWRRSHREGEYGALATDREMLERVSPLPLVDQIAAPLMVFHGRQDARVPLYESEQIVDAVRNRGLDVELHIYDDEGHIFSKRANLIDAFGKIGEFLSRHLPVARPH